MIQVSSSYLTGEEDDEARDPKGLYRLARAGKLPNLTGVGSAYEPPELPELVLHGGAEMLAEKVLKLLKQRAIV